MAATAVAKVVRPGLEVQCTRKQHASKRHRTLTVFSGLMGSGKTTAARKLKENNSTAWLISRDDIRNALFCGADLFPDEEETITTILLNLASLGLEMNHDVIIDDVNIFPDEKVRWHALAAELGVKIRWRCMTTDIEECVRRDALRPKPVGRSVIEQYAAAAGLTPSQAQ
jgi:predicted kinase